MKAVGYQTIADATQDKFVFAAHVHGRCSSCGATDRLSFIAINFTLYKICSAYCEHSLIQSLKDK